MDKNTALITEFYRCFAQLDGEGMTACYHENISFSDPVFPQLQGQHAKAMWHMLCAQAREFELSFKLHHVNEQWAKANWQAHYTFSQTGRRVHNQVEATFHFQDGKIISHKDVFNFWHWSAMALGSSGTLLGWTPILRNKVRTQAMKKLNAYMRQA